MAERPGSVGAADGEPGGPALNTDLLTRAAAGTGVRLSAAEMTAFARYAETLREWNARLNLTRVTGADDVAVRHFADSLVCLRGLPEDPGRDAPLALVDVGSGAGLPGIALKIVRPAWRVTLVESVGKKAAFLDHVVACLGLTGVTVLCARAEDVGRDVRHRGTYDVAVARAVADLAVLAEYLLPLLVVGGRMVVPKGAHAATEAAGAARALDALGGRLLSVDPYLLPGVPDERCLVVVEKARQTPERYPRRAGMPSRRPL
jgi:16S rRNA (guanine527-N7)-methyltransferase